MNKTVELMEKIPENLLVGNKNLETAVEVDKEGYLYCLHNKMFLSVAPNVYKLGQTSNMAKRLGHYITCYIEKPTIKYLSQKVKNKKLAEKVLFMRLEDKRCVSNREFFNCELNEIINQIEKVVNDVNNDLVDESILIKSIQPTVKEQNMTKRDKIANAKDIDRSEYDILKAQKTQLSVEDKLAIDRYELKKIWKLKELNEDFLFRWFGKTHVLKNLRYLLGKQILPLNDIDTIQKVTILKDMFLKLGFGNIEINKVVDNQTFTKGIATARKECKLFTEPTISHPLFGLGKYKINNIKTFMGFFNTIIKEWGLKIKKKPKMIKVKIDSQWKSKSLNNFILTYLDDISEYL